MKKIIIFLFLILTICIFGEGKRNYKSFSMENNMLLTYSDDDVEDEDLEMEEEEVDEENSEYWETYVEDDTLEDDMELYEAPIEDDTEKNMSDFIKKKKK